jgi:hypothetical protein
MLCRPWEVLKYSGDAIACHAEPFAALRINSSKHLNVEILRPDRVAAQDDNEIASASA